MGVLILKGSEVVNNHFANDSLLSHKDDQELVNGALTCLETFCIAFGIVGNAHKIDYWIIGLDSSHAWIPTT